MGWIDDTLYYLSEDPVNRRRHHGGLTFPLVYTFSENYTLSLSHDKVVHDKRTLVEKMPGDDWQRFAGLHALFAYQWSHPGKQLAFTSQEIAQRQEWNESYSLDWWLADFEGYAGVQRLVIELSRVYTRNSAFWDGDYISFKWIDAPDGDHSLTSYLRKGQRDGSGQPVVVCAVNFAGNPREGYRIGLSFGDEWTEILNIGAEDFGGSGVTNPGTIAVEPIPWNGRPYSVELRIPPPGVL